MGLTLHNLQLNEISITKTIKLVTEKLVTSGWQRTNKKSARSQSVYISRSKSWTQVHLPRYATQKLVEDIIKTTGISGIYFSVSDSDYWDVTLFRDSKKWVLVDTRKKIGNAKKIKKELQQNLNIQISEESIGEILSSDPTFAEAALGAFAELISISNILEVPDQGVTELFFVPALSEGEQQLAQNLDLRVQVFSYGPPAKAGFGKVAMNILSHIGVKFKSSELGFKRITVKYGLNGEIKHFTKIDLPSIAEQLDAGEVDEVQCYFDNCAFTCRSNNNKREVQIIFDQLMTTDGQLNRPDTLSLLNPTAALIKKLFVNTNASVGMIEVVSSSVDMARDDLMALVAWPPKAHWITYLSANSLKNKISIKPDLDQWQVTQFTDGATLLRQVRPAHLSRDRKGIAMREQMTKRLVAAVVKK